MSINTVGGQDYTAGQTQQIQQTHHGHGAGRGAHKAGMDAAANALGMSTDDLRSALRGGQSLESLAQSKGISTDSLISTISNALTQANPQLSADRADQIAQRMVNGPERVG
ncbi:MAG TPA: hypothetical protein VJT31_25145 [Rugosimonospora sp.]|nr:hypothetical protein [Rugosimonospora sp.]